MTVRKKDCSATQEDSVQLFKFQTDFIEYKPDRRDYGSRGWRYFFECENGSRGRLLLPLPLLGLVESRQGGYGNRGRYGSSGDRRGREESRDGG